MNKNDLGGILRVITLTEGFSAWDCSSAFLWTPIYDIMTNAERCLLSAAALLGTRGGSHSTAVNTEQIGICHVKGYLSPGLERCTSSCSQLLKHNLFWFIPAARLDVMLQVWDNGGDQRGKGVVFPLLNNQECTLLTSVWNTKLDDLSLSLKVETVALWGLFATKLGAS